MTSARGDTVREVANTLERIAQKLRDEHPPDAECAAEPSPVPWTPDGEVWVDDYGRRMIR